MTGSTAHGHSRLFHALRHLAGPQVERPRAIGDLAINHDIQTAAYEQEAFAVVVICGEIAGGFQHAWGHP